MSARDDYPNLAALASAPFRLPEYANALDEIDRLRQWKSEAFAVLANLDDAFERTGINGGLGQSKPDLMASEIDRLRSAATELRATA